MEPGQAAARVVAEFADQAVGIDQGERPAAGIVGGDPGGLAESVGDSGEIALGIVGVGGDVRDVAAGSVDTGEQTLIVVGIGGGAPGTGGVVDEAAAEQPTGDGVTAQERTTTTEWHPDFERPVRIVEAARTRTIYNWLQYFSPEALEHELKGSGLDVEKRYGDVAGSTYNPEHTEFAVVARKRLDRE